MEHSPTSATGTAWERMPWHTTQRAAWEALDRASRRLEFRSARLVSQKFAETYSPSRPFSCTKTGIRRSQLPPITLSDDERETLHGWLRRHSTAQALAQPRAWCR